MTALTQDNEAEDNRFQGVYVLQVRVLNRG